MSSRLGAPLYFGASAVVGGAAPMNVTGGTPESGLHPQGKEYHGGHVTSIQASPYQMPEPLSATSVPEVTFVLVVFVVLGRLVYVWVLDAAGKVLARAGGHDGGAYY
jgi:hypothetical protein